MSDPHEKHEHEPRWDVIEKLHDKIDGEINEAFRVNRMSFIEVDITLLMLKEKLSQQKMELYNLYITQEENPSEHKATSPEDSEAKADAPEDLYK